MNYSSKGIDPFGLAYSFVKVNSFFMFIRSRMLCYKIYRRSSIVETYLTAVHRKQDVQTLYLISILQLIILTFPYYMSYKFHITKYRLIDSNSTSILSMPWATVLDISLVRATRFKKYEKRCRSCSVHYDIYSCIFILSWVLQFAEYLINCCTPP